MPRCLAWALLACGVLSSAQSIAAEAAVAPVVRAEVQILIEADADHPACILEQPAEADTPAAWGLLTIALHGHLPRALTWRVCADAGQWHSVVEGPQALVQAEVALAADPESGIQQLRASLPAAWLGAARPLAMRVLAVDPNSGAVDRLAQPDGTWTVLRLPLSGAAAPVPALGIAATLLLLGAVCWLGLRARMPRPGWSAEGLLLLLCVLALPLTTGDAADTTPGSSAAADDRADPDSSVRPDLLRAELLRRGDRLEIGVRLRGLAPAPRAPARVLFLGNSLTYSNDLPKMVQALAVQAGESLEVEQITVPGAALEDLYRGSGALDRIAHGAFDVVVLQQGPSALAASQAELRHWAQAFNGPIRSSGARPALCMVWPEEARSHVFDAVRTSYAQAAADIGAAFLPAGESWRSAWRGAPQLPLYGEDRFHPSVLGSYAAATTIFAGLYDRSPVGLPAALVLRDGPILALEPEATRLLQEAAWEAWQHYGRRGF